MSVGRAVDDRQMNAAEDVPRLLQQAHGNQTQVPNHGHICMSGGTVCKWLVAGS